MSSMAASSFCRAFLFICEPRQTLTRLASCFMEYSCTQNTEKREREKSRVRLTAWGWSYIILHPVPSSHPVVFDKLLHIVLRQVISLDVGLHKLFIGDGAQVGQLLQLHEELLEVQLHQGSALVATFLHVSVAAEERRGKTSSVYRGPITAKQVDHRCRLILISRLCSKYFFFLHIFIQLAYSRELSVWGQLWAGIKQKDRCAQLILQCAQLNIWLFSKIISLRNTERQIFCSYHAGHSALFLPSNALTQVRARSHPIIYFHRAAPSPNLDWLWMQCITSLPAYSECNVKVSDTHFTI